MIERNQYLDWLIKYQKNDLIKVISGVRRSGKSTIFSLFKEYLLSQGILESNIISINFEDLRYYELRDFMKLYSYLVDQVNPQEQFYIFLDEIQLVSRYEEVVNSLNLLPNTDIYITGSNAYFMSGELATLLTGRYIELKILPLSYKEYASLYPNLTLERIYDQYKLTSFPYLADKHDPNIINTYIRSAYNDIAMKDIIERYKITEQNLLERVLRFMVSAVGSEISLNKITNTLKTHGVSISNNTLERYVDAFVNGLILYQVPRYDIKGRKLLQRFEKYYVVDLGFRNLLLPDRVEDEGHILENIVYFELLRRYCAVYIGKHDSYEVDFICLDDRQNPTYFQVALETLSEDTLKRELRSLQTIKDHHPKFLLTLDSINREGNYDGVIKRYVLDWLLE